ncbi:MAG: anthranilate synthase component I, partial [Deltaproteobacteria bacterium]|nr:anthranilate synthase component I [Deltaproteobacteria bacterium]
MITPDLTLFKSLVAEGANIIPVWKEIAVDFDTPVSLFAKLGENSYSFLLESLEGGEKWGRYSFIGFRPFMIFGCKGNDIFTEIEGKRKIISAANPLTAMREIMARFSPAEVRGLPRFYGGAVGYMGYDMVRFMERLPENLPDTAGFNDAVFMFPELLLVYDNIKQTLKIIACLRVEQDDKAESVYLKGKSAIKDVIRRIRHGLDYPAPHENPVPATSLNPEVP